VSLLTPFEEARATLGLGATEEDTGTIKRAYRRAIAAHPPDRDPEAFQRVRDAYELLTNPGRRAREMLLYPVPMAAPPAPPPAQDPPPRGTAAVALLRLLATRIDQDAWSSLAGAASEAPRATADRSLSQSAGDGASPKEAP
jgi:hypothetical protein